jgi:hypothetical protein
MGQAGEMLPAKKAVSHVREIDFFFGISLSSTKEVFRKHLEVHLCFEVSTHNVSQCSISLSHFGSKGGNQEQ